MTTPPEPTTTPHDRATSTATDHAAHQEQRPQPTSAPAKAGHAAATRTEGEEPGPAGMPRTNRANEARKRETPKAATTAAADEKAGAATERTD